MSRTQPSKALYLTTTISNFYIMKQHFFTRGGVLLAVMSVFLSFFACRQDQIIDASPPDAGVAFRQSARQYYDSTLATLRKANIDKAKADARFTALDFTPDWGASIKHTGNGKTYLEVPVKFAENSALMTSGSSTTTQFNPDIDIEIPTRLIISKSEKGDWEANFMVIRADFPYPNGIVPDFNLSQKIDGFSGREYLFSLDRMFNKGWMHKNGQIVNTFVLGQNDLRQQQLGTRLCSAWFLIDDNTGRIIQQLTPWSCTAEISGSGGGDSFNAWGAGGGPTDTDSKARCPECNTTFGIRENFVEVDYKVYDFDIRGNPFYLTLGGVYFNLAVSGVKCKEQTYSNTTISAYTDFFLPGSTLSRGGEYVTEVRKERIKPTDARCGFRLVTQCGGDATLNVWTGPWSGYPFQKIWFGEASFIFN
jgi:hypothetical protein